MSVISALFDNKVYNFAQAFNVQDITSAAMKAAILDWFALYYGAKGKNVDEDPCQRLPVAVVTKLTKTTFSEYSATAAGSNPFVKAVLNALDDVRKKAMHQALIGGECFLKPVFGQDQSVSFGVVSRQSFVVLGRNSRDEITDIGTSERTMYADKHYTLLERRSVDHAGYLTIQSKLYQSDSEQYLGTEVPLTTLEQYAAIPPVNRLPQPVGSIGMVPLRTPLENCVDGGPDAVSVYAPAVGLIHNINRNEAQLNAEFSNAESRIIASADLFKWDGEGRKKLTDHVFTAVEEDPKDIGITIFSPAIREQSFLARKTEYLRNMETLIGLKRGILSEVEATERTATEVTSSAGDYNLTIIDFQQMWEKAVRKALRVCDILGKMYRVNSGGSVDPEKDVVIDWGNGILYDEEKEWSNYMGMVGAGMLKPEIALAWKFNLPWETPADLQKIREKYMPELEQMTEGGDE